MKAKTLFLWTYVLSTGMASASIQILCKADEKVFFSCHVNKNIVSVCMSSESVAFPYMEYRFGTTQKIEMRYRGDFSQPKFNRVSVSYASNAATILWFRNTGTDYLLNFPMKGAPSLEVKTAGKTIAEMTCRNGWEAVVGEPEQPSQFISDKPNTDFANAQKYWQR